MSTDETQPKPRRRVWPLGVALVLAALVTGLVLNGFGV